MIKKLFQTYGILAAWILSLVSLLGSFYFSNVLDLKPCVLCWYQRILLFPMVWLLAVAYFKKDKLVYLQTLPLLGLGWLISLYHNLLYYKILPQSIAPCEQGVSCTTKLIEIFGFITIPLLAFTSFTILIILLTLHRRSITSIKD
jgi:disulfide bond formation protein DsbB